MDRYFYDPLQENIDRILRERSEYANEFEWKYRSPCEPQVSSKFEMADSTVKAIKLNRVLASRYQKKRAAAIRKRYSKQLFIG